MKTKFRVLLGAAAGALLALTALSPALAAPAGSYTGVADGTGLSLTIAGQGVHVGISHAELNSAPTASASGAGLVEIPTTIAESDAPPDGQDSKSVVDTDVPLGVGDLQIAVLKGTSSAEVSGDPSASGVGELAGAQLVLSPGGVPLISTPAFAVRSTSDVTVAGKTVTAAGHADAVYLQLNLADTLVSPVCDLLGTLPLPLDLGQACQDAVDQVAPLTTVATIRVLPADVACVYDGASGLASVPTAQASILSVQVFNEAPITVTPGTTIDLLPDTDLHIHAVLGDAATHVDGNEASAEASGLLLRVFQGALPQIELKSSDVTCGVAGQLPPPPPPHKRSPVTGGVLPPVILGASALLLVGFGARRLARVS